MITKKIMRLGMMAFMVALIASLTACQPGSKPNAPEALAEAPATGPSAEQPTPAIPASALDASVPQSAASPQAAASGPSVTTSAAGPKPEGQAGLKKVIVYYFHTTARCASCYKIEEYAREAVQTVFPDELKSGRIEFQTYNVDEEQYKHFAKDYGLYTKSVVLSEVVDGKEMRSKNLGQVWEMHQDKTALIAYLTEEIRAFIAGK